MTCRRPHPTLPARPADDHLRARLEKYDRWMTGGLIPAGSRVVPVRRPIVARPWIMPPSQVSAILGTATAIAVDDCVCRAHYGRCDLPRDVCLLLDAAAEARVLRGTGRRVSILEALDLVDLAAESGLVHLAVYSPDQPLLSLCSCCACCCYQLGMLAAFDRRDLVVRADYVAVHEADRCRRCGACTKRCLFGALPAPGSGVDPELCYGCGLCAAVCPTGALTLKPRGR